MLMLRVLYELYQNNPTSEVKRARYLKEACDDRLNPGDTMVYTTLTEEAPFEWCLKDSKAST